MFDEDGISGPRLNDEVETEKSLTKEEKLAENEARTTNSVAEKNEEVAGEKDSDDGIKKSKESTPEQTTV